jgi:hypothetical protein
MACLVLTAKPLKMGKSSKFNKGWEPLKGHKNEEVGKIVKIFYLDTTNFVFLFIRISRIKSKFKKKL